MLQVLVNSGDARHHILLENTFYKENTFYHPAHECAGAHLAARQGTKRKRREHMVNTFCLSTNTWARDKPTRSAVHVVGRLTTACNTLPRTQFARLTTASTRSAAHEHSMFVGPTAVPRT